MKFWVNLILFEMICYSLSVFVFLFALMVQFNEYNFLFMREVSIDQP